MKTLILNRFRIWIYLNDPQHPEFTIVDFHRVIEDGAEGENAVYMFISNLHDEVTGKEIAPMLYSDFKHDSPNDTWGFEIDFIPNELEAWLKLSPDELYKVGNEELAVLLLGNSRR